MRAANERYLAFMATLDNPDAGLRTIDKMAKPARDRGRSYRGFNLFLNNDFASKDSHAKKAYDKPPQNQCPT
jgi:hypothetical protein